jgi:UDP-2,3-diacylglucosamine hydrolase
MSPVVRHASALLVSDLHLAPERPDITARFHAFLARHAAGAEALFILGDFFELWVGDDTLDIPLHRETAETLRRLADSGTRLYVLPGNRDFLLGEDFARATGVTLLPDPCQVELAGLPTLICHGDHLCTDDTDYQAWRRQNRDPAWQRSFLTRPLAERMAYGRQVRMKSEDARSLPTPVIVDVNPDAVVAAFRQAGVTRLIHGHTHRPARHELDWGEGRAERWVLPDWDVEGGGLLCDAQGCRPVGIA